MDRLFLFFKFLHYHLGAVWHLLVIIQEYFFADYLRDEEPCGFIRKRILAEVFGYIQ